MNIPFNTDNYNDDVDNDLSIKSNESIEIVMTKGAQMLKDMQTAFASSGFPQQGIPPELIAQALGNMPPEMREAAAQGGDLEILILPDSSEEDEESNEGKSNEGKGKESQEDVSGEENYVIEVGAADQITDDMCIRVMEMSNNAQGKVTIDTGDRLVELSEREAKLFEREVEDETVFYRNKTDDEKRLEEEGLEMNGTSEVSEVETDPDVEVVSEEGDGNEVLVDVGTLKSQDQHPPLSQELEEAEQAGVIDSDMKDSNDNGEEGSRVHVVDMTKMFVPIAEISDSDLNQSDLGLEEDTSGDPADWMSASINSLIESANEAVKRGITKEQILANLSDIPEKDSDHPMNDAEVSSAIHDTVAEKFDLFNTMNSEHSSIKDNQSRTMSESTTPEIPEQTEQTLTMSPSECVRPKKAADLYQNLKQSRPKFQPVPMQKSASLEVEDGSNRSTPISARSSDELLQLLEAIGQQGQEMKSELESAYAREAYFMQENSEENPVPSRALDRLSKEVEVLRDENKRMHQEVKDCRIASERDRTIIGSLEGSVHKLQDIISILQEENHDKETNDTHSQTDKVITVHQESQIQVAKTISQNTQTKKPCVISTGISTEQIRQRSFGTYTSDRLIAFKVDAGVQVFVPLREDEIKHLQHMRELNNSAPGSMTTSSSKTGKKASQMIDDILYQMSTIATTEDKSGDFYATKGKHDYGTNNTAL